MDLRSYLRFLRGNWEWIAALTSIGVVAAMALSLSTTPKFAATSELFLTTPGYSTMGSLSTFNTSPYQADSFSQQRARSYVELATRVDLARRVTDTLDINMRPEDLAAATSATVAPDTVLMNITVRASSSAEAKALADAVTAELANDIRKLETPSGTLIPTVDPVVTQPAGTPTRPVEPNIAIYLILGATAGFLAGISAAAWLTRRRAVAGSQAVEQITGRPVFGTVRSLSRQDGSIAEDSTSESINRQWRMVQRNVAFELEETGDSVIAIAGLGPSDRSSEAARDLACAFAGAASRVVLVTMSSDASDHANSPDNATVGLAGVVAGEAPLHAVIRPGDIANLSILAGPGPGNPAPLMLSEKFGEVVRDLRESFDLVIFDCPELLELAESAVLSEEVGSIVVVLTEKTDRRGLHAVIRLAGDRHMRLLGSILTSSHPEHRIGISQPSFRHTKQEA